MRSFAATTITAAGILFLLANSTSADLYLKQKQTVGKKTKTTETWSTKDGYRIDEGKTSLILPAKNKHPLVLLHDNQTFVQYTRSIDDDPKMKELTMIVDERPGTKMIGQWECIKHTITVSSPKEVVMRQEIWSTEDIELSEENALLYRTYILGPIAGRSEEFLKELKKVRGVEVLSILTDFTDRASPPEQTELISLNQKKAPGGILDIPAGYNQEK